MKSIRQWWYEGVIPGKDPDMFRVDNELEGWQEEWVLNVVRRHGFEAVARMLMPLVHPASHAAPQRDGLKTDVPDWERPQFGDDPSYGGNTGKASL